MTYSRLAQLALNAEKRTDRQQINAGIVHDLAQGIATTAPNAFVLVISNPVNSTVPIVAEVYKKQGKFNPKRYVFREPRRSVLIIA